MTTKGRIAVAKALVWVACLAPLAVMAWRLFLGGGLGVNPTETIEHWSGRTTLILLLGTLAVTPLRRLTGWNQLQKFRRLLGLFGFFWASLHFLAWMGLDQVFALAYIGEDIAERPYILVGTLAFLLLMPLAVTSTRGWIRRLGKNWVRLHRLVYAAALLGVVHYFWITKADDRWPFLALGAWAILMVLRLPFLRLGRRGRKARAGERRDAARRPSPAGTVSG